MIFYATQGVIRGMLRSSQAMDRDFVLMIRNMQAVGYCVIRFAEMAVGEMRLEGGAVAVETGDGGSQAGSGGAPGQGWREHWCPGDGLRKRMAHFSAQFEDGECRCAHGVLKQGAFGLRKAIHAHFDALGEVLQYSRERPCAGGFHAGSDLKLIKPEQGLGEALHFGAVVGKQRHGQRDGGCDGAALGDEVSALHADIVSRMSFE